MTTSSRFAPLFAAVRESVVTALSQRVASAIALVMVAGMCASVLLTTGRSVGAEQQVIATIDDAGTRSIVIRADPDAGLDSSVLQRLASIQGIQWAGAFGLTTDAQNEALPDGTKVPLRTVWTSDPSVLGIEPSISTGEEVWASHRALALLGISDLVGSVSTKDGRSYFLRGELRVPDFLSMMQPLLLAPAGQPGTVSTLIVVAQRPDLVAAIARTVQSVLAVSDPTKIEIATSERLATLRSIVEGKLSAFSRSLVIVIFGLTALLVAAILYGLVMMRRKDFGRRRALGASQGLVVALVLIQVGAIALVGTALGTAVALVVLILGGDPLPDAGFVCALAIIAVFISTAAGLVPAIAAARREPIKELRVP